MILGILDPYIVPGTVGGGGSTLPADSAGYLYNDGAGNLSYDTAPTPEPAGSTTQIQYNKAGVQSGSANLTYDETKLYLNSEISTHTPGAATITYTFDVNQEMDVQGDWTYGSRQHRTLDIAASIATTNRVRTSLYGEYARMTDAAVFDETVYAAGYLRASNSGPPSDGESVTFGTVTYTFRNTLSAEGDVKIGASMLVTLQNLQKAVNGTGTVGVEHQCTSANADVEAVEVSSSGLPTITIQALVAGSAGDSIAFTESVARLAPYATGATTLTRSLYQNVLYWQDIAMTAATAKSGGMYGTNMMMNGPTFPESYSAHMYGTVYQMIVNGTNEAHTRGMLVGHSVSLNVFGGRPSKMMCFGANMQVANDGATYFGSTPEAHGLFVDALQGSGTGKIDAAYGVYISDLASAVPGLATLAYGLYIAGATQNNYIAGNLEVAGTLTATIAAAGTDTQVIYNSSGSYAGASTIVVEDASAYTAVVGAGLALNVGDLRIYKHSSTANNIFHSTINDVTVDFWSNSNGGLRFICGSDFISSPGATTPPVWSVLSATGVVTMNLSSYIDDATGAAINIIKQRKTVADPGQDADVIGTVAFKGYNDRAAGSGGPELTMFASMYATIADASDTTEDGQIDFSFITGGSPQNSVRMDGSGVKLPYAAGGGTLNYMTAGGANGYRMMYLGGNAAFVLYDDLNTAYGQWMSKSGNMFFMSNETQSLGTNAFRCLGIGNLAVVAPTAVATDHVQIWCADYGAGDARLYVMGEASTKTVIIGDGEVIADGEALIGASKMENSTPAYRDVTFTYEVPGTVSTWNPADTTSGCALTNSNLTWDHGSGGAGTWRHGRGTTGKSSGKWYFELVSTGDAADNPAFGLAKLGFNISVNNLPGYDTNAWGYVLGDGKIYYNGSGTAYKGSASGASPRTFGVAVDMDAGMFWISEGGTYLNSGNPVTQANPAATGLSGFTLFPVASCAYDNHNFTINFGATAFTYGPPSGFTQWDGNTKVVTGRVNYIKDAKEIIFDPTTLLDHECRGEFFYGTCGETTTLFQTVYRKSDSKFWLSDADASTTMPVVAMASAAMTADATGQKYLIRGWARDDSWNWTVGGLLYADTTTAGGMTQTAPSGSGDQVQILGWALTADIIRFDPELIMVEV